MNRTIPCLLLTLCLLLLSAAAMAASDPDNYIFDIKYGNITIEDGTAGTLKVTYGNEQEKDNIPPGQTITVLGTTPTLSSKLSIQTITPVKIDYRVFIGGPSSSCSIIVANGADVSLVLNYSDCQAWGDSIQPGIKLGSGSRLTIESQDVSSELSIRGVAGGIVGPSDTKAAATVILNSGILYFPPIDGGSYDAISGNVNLVINSGKLEAYNNDIDVQNLIVTGGELWAGSDSGTKVTHQNLSSYSNIKCAAGILPNHVDDYYSLVVFGGLTLPVDLTIPNDRTLYFYENSNLTIPEGKTLTIALLAELSLTDSATLTNYGTLNILGGHTSIFGTLNNLGTMITHLNVSMMDQNSVLNNYGTLIIEDNKLTHSQGTLNNYGTISGEGSIYPKLNQDKPTSLTVNSIENGTTVTLTEVEAGITDAEYSKDGKNWRDTPVFEGVDLSAGCTFYARYKENSFFNASGPASVSVYPVTLHLTDINRKTGYYIAGQVTPLPIGKDVTRTGYDFAGWYANESCTGSPVTEIDTDVPGAKKYWAKWIAKTYMVKLHPNGGTIIGDDLTGYTYGVGATLPDADRTGYVFAGWFESAALTGSPVVAISETSADDREFWAGWIARPVITSPTENRTVTVYEGESATMTITVENAVAYQWYMSTDGGNNWTACGENSPAYTTSPTKMEHSGYQYMCVVTGSPEPKGAEDKEELPPEELPPEGAQMSLRSRATDDGLTGPMEESPIFTLEVIRKDAIPQTGDSSRMGLWLALAGGCALALACIGLRREKRA